MNWSKINIFTVGVLVELANAEGVGYVFYGKPVTAGIGPPASGDYVGLKIENTTITQLYVCNSGTLETINVSQSVSGVTFSIVSENGSVIFYQNGVSIGASSAGPTNANPSGSLSFEIANGATAAAYSLGIISMSEAGA